VNGSRWQNTVRSVNRWHKSIRPMNHLTLTAWGTMVVLAVWFVLRTLL